jgi:hypothetical protein
MEKLAKDNFLLWSEKIKDHILALDCEDAEAIWDAFTWTPDPAQPSANQEDPALAYSSLPSSNAPQRKTKQKHAAAYAYIRRALSPAVFSKTIGQPTNVPLLLRLLKRNWNDNSTQDRDRMRQNYYDLKLADYADVDEFITVFMNHVAVMRQHDMGSVARDEDVLFDFNKRLPQAWAVQKEVSSASGLKLSAAHAYYLKAAGKDASLPGTTICSKTPDSVHFTSTNDNNKTETCRNFAKGSCKRGSSCHYLHTTPPNRPLRTGNDRDRQRSSSTCTYCKRQGHEARRCFKRLDDHDAATADKTNVTQEAGDGNTKPSAATVPEDRYDSGICIDGVAFITTECGDVGPIDAGPVDFDSTNCKRRTELQRLLSAAEATTAAGLTDGLAANCNLINPVNLTESTPASPSARTMRDFSRRNFAKTTLSTHPTPSLTSTRC